MTSPLPGTIGSSLPPVVSGVTALDVLFGIQGGTTKKFPIPFIIGASPTSFVGCTQVSAAGDYNQQPTDQVIYLKGPHTRNINLLPASLVAGHLLWIKVDVNGTTNTQRILADASVPDLIEGLDHIDLSGAYQWILLYPLETGLWLLFT